MSDMKISVQKVVVSLHSFASEIEEEVEEIESATISTEAETKEISNGICITREFNGWRTTKIIMHYRVKEK